MNSSSSISGWFYKKKSTINSYFNLSEENNILLEQNAVLKREALKNYNLISDKNILFNGEKYELIYNYQPATILKNTTNSRKNVLTLNVGSAKGIKKEMGIISPKGIVGFVKDVSENYSTVMSIMNSQFRLTVKPKGDSCSGLLYWNNSNEINEATVRGIPTYFDIKKGDTIVTQGTDGIFPVDENIGVIENIKIESGKNTYILTLQLTVDFYAISTVFIVKNNRKSELDSIQKVSQK
jgi:rod shape-determining protein MreC